MKWQLLLPAVALFAVAYAIVALAGRAIGKERLRRLRPWIRVAGFVPLLVIGLLGLVDR